MDYGGIGELYNPKIIILCLHCDNTLLGLSTTEVQLYYDSLHFSAWIMLL